MVLFSFLVFLPPAVTLDSDINHYLLLLLLVVHYNIRLIRGHHPLSLELEVLGDIVHFDPGASTSYWAQLFLNIMLANWLWCSKSGLPAGILLCSSWVYKNTKNKQTKKNRGKKS